MRTCEVLSVREAWMHRHVPMYQHIMSLPASKTYPRTPLFVRTIIQIYILGRAMSRRVPEGRQPAVKVGQSGILKNVFPSLTALDAANLTMRSETDLFP